MMHADGHEEMDKPRVMETASGTTSPDNAQSGNFAYVIAAIAVAVSLLMGRAFSAWMMLVGDLIIDGYENYEPRDYDNDDWSDDPYGINEFEDLLEDLEQGVWRYQ